MLYFFLLLLLFFGGELFTISLRTLLTESPASTIILKTSEQSNTRDATRCDITWLACDVTDEQVRKSCFGGVRWTFFFRCVSFCLNPLTEMKCKWRATWTEDLWYYVYKSWSYVELNFLKRSLWYSAASYQHLRTFTHARGSLEISSMSAVISDKVKKENTCTFTECTRLSRLQMLNQGLIIAKWKFTIQYTSFRRGSR